MRKLQVSLKIVKSALYETYKDISFFFKNVGDPFRPEKPCLYENENK